ncbi:MAG: hypothetical protein WBH45_13585 [Acidobacteriaceae bacterium]
MKPSRLQMPAAFASMAMVFASLLLVLACLFLPAAAGAQGVSTTTTILPVNSANQVTQFQPVSLEALVSNPEYSVTGGTVAFYDNGTLISGCGTSAVNAVNGIAVCSSKAKDAR